MAYEQEVVVLLQGQERVYVVVKGVRLASMLGGFWGGPALVIAWPGAVVTWPVGATQDQGHA